MLEVIPYRNSLEKEKYLSQFDPMTQTWLVSDLRSKLFLQDYWLKKYQTGFPGENTLRATDLWRKLISLMRPDLQVVSTDFFSILIEDQLKSHKDPSLYSPGTGRLVLEYITQFLPLLLHPSQNEIWQGWLEKDSSIEARLGRWWRLSQEYFQLFFAQKIILPQWIPALLTYEGNYSLYWDKALWVDLGLDLTLQEIEILELISREVDVKIFVPSSENLWSKKEVLNPYQGLLNVAELSQFPPTRTATVRYQRFSTSLGEIKNVVHGLRQELEKGIPLTSLGIVMPKPEDWLYALTHYLRAEGIPYRARLNQSLAHSTGVQKWLAKMQVEAGQGTASDFLLFGRHELQETLSFEDFSRLYAKIYDDQDLQRYPHLFQRLKSFDSQDRLTRDQFLQWALSFWKKEESDEPLLKALSRFILESPANQDLSLEAWLQFLRQLVVRLEVTYQNTLHEEGVEILNLSSVEGRAFSTIFVLGVQEEALRDSSPTAIESSDQWFLMQNFGVALQIKNTERKQIELLHILNQNFAQVILSCSNANLLGELQSPASLWFLSQMADTGKFADLEPAPMTVWESEALQKTWIEKKYPGLLDKLHDESHCEVPLQRFRLSPSAIEDYLECPFIFAAKRVFHLSDLPSLDIDVDRMTKGKMLHATFELATPYLMSQEPVPELEILEAAKAKAEVDLLEKGSWERLQRVMQNHLQRFISFERERRKALNSSAQIFAEVEIRGFYSTKEAKFYAGDRLNSEDLEVKGFIDRVDVNGQGEALIIDYKSGGSKLSQHDGWTKRGLVQIPFYALALEAGLSALPIKKVVGGFYYRLKPWGPRYGYILDDATHGLMPLETRAKIKLSADDIQDKHTLYRSTIQNTVQNILQGQFDPKPLDEKNCLNCSWRTVCRAPHLK